MDFACRIDGALLRCTITPDRDLSAPVFCFSGMAPMAVVDGGTMVASLGSQAEVQLPDLAADVPYAVIIRYADPAHRPANRAWMPLGPYLRCGSDCIPLPALPAGAVAPDYSALPPVSGLRIVPQPTSWAPDGHTAQITRLHSAHAKLSVVDQLFVRLGLGPVGAPDGHPVTVVGDDRPEDAYQLTITTDGTTLHSGSDGGTQYGLQTLATLMKTHDGGVPCGVITDAPRFSWRGQHLDCARHFFDVTTITHLLDLMALLKLNRFHWHFADDEAFRIQLKSLPDLWQKLEYRGEGELLPGLFGGGIRAGGSYTRAQVADLVAHAADLNIQIMPEIEVPAHALGLARVYPAMRDPGDNGQEATVQGYTQSAVNPAMPATWDILAAMVAEMAVLFPFGVLHLGCDELAADTWMSSPAARRLMAREGLETTKDLQGWMMAKLAATLAPHGLRAGAWEEAAQGQNGGIGHDAILFSWTGQGAGVAAARAGYDVVMTPAQHVYLDMAHSDDPDDWGANWAAYVGLADTINWDPVPSDILDFEHNIIGVQGTFWGEFTTDDSQMMPMLMPRILGVAVKAWQADDTMDAATLERLAGSYQRLLR